MIKIKILSKKVIRVFASSLFILTFTFSISHAYVPNSTWTNPNGTTYSGLLIDLFTSSNSNPSGPPSPGFSGPSGFNIDGFTGENANSTGNNTIGGAPISPITPTPGGSGSTGGGISCTGQARNFRELIINLAIGCILSPLVYLIIAVSVIAFLWGVFKFIRAEGDEKQAGREFMLYGIIGLFVMVSVWGLVSILSNTFNLNNSSIAVPSLQN